MLGAILLDERHLSAAMVDERLAVDDFYREQHGQVFKAMVALFEAGRSIDHLTVVAQMREHGDYTSDTTAMVDELAGWTPAAGHSRDYARLVKTCSLRRSLLTSTYEIQAGIHSDAPIRELIDQAEQRMLSISDAGATELGKLVADEELERMRRVRDGVEVVALSSGFKDLDKFTAGFQPGNLIVLAARPSMGKSALVVNFAENVVAEGGAGVALFSLEMSRGEILRRLLASRANVSGDTLLRGPIPPDVFERVEKAADEVGGWPLFVDEGVDCGIIDVRAKARRLHKRFPIGLVIVDYVQLMRGEGVENRNLEVGRITRGLKVLAKELEVPVIAVSQLSRAVEQRGDKHPQLSDLRDSGSVEQDADLVLFLYRESYYNDEAEEPEVTELVLAKQRNGPIGTVKLTFLDRFPKFAAYLDTGHYHGTPEAMSMNVGSSGDPMPF